MSIEQQVRDAIVDFHDLIAEGRDISVALQEASAANGLKDGVLEQRLSKAMPIDEIVGQIRHETDPKQTYETIYDVVLEYVVKEKKWFKRDPQIREEVAARVEACLHHQLSSEELAQVDAAYTKALKEMSLMFQREFARTLRNAEQKTNVED